MSIIQTFGHYTGQGDIDKVKQGTTNLDVENVTQQIAGKPKFISDNSKDVGTFTFHQKNQSGQNIETYYVKGKWYFTETDKSLRHISGLSALFGNQNIDRIVFTGVCYKLNYGLVEMVGVNDSLYVLNANHSYVSVGKIQNFVPANIRFITFVGVPTSADYYAYDFSGNAYHATVSVNNNFVPSIAIGQKRNVPFMLLAFRPTGCNISPTGVTGQAQMNYVNSNLGIYSTRYTGQGVYTEQTSKIEVEAEYKPEILLGTTFRYEIKEAVDWNEQVALLELSESIMDTSTTTDTYTYNNKLQKKKISRQLYELNQESHSFSLSRIVDNETEYLWESEQQCAALAAELAQSFVSRVSEKITEPDTSSYVYNNAYSYAVRTAASGQRVYYVSTSGVDGLLEDQSTQHEKCLAYDGSGKPTLTEMTRVSNSHKVNASKTIYTNGKATLPVATFTGVLVGDSQERVSAHYLGFEPYEEFSINDSALSSTYFSASGVQLVDISYAGSRGMRFTQQGAILCTDSFHIDTSMTYCFSCWRKTANSQNWKFYEALLSGEQLNENRSLATFAANESVTHIMLKTVDCTSEVVVYDPDTYQVKAKMDNSGTFTRFIMDKLSRIYLSYTEKLIPVESVNGNYYEPDSKFAVSDCAILGYAAFSGYNCGSQMTTAGYNSSTKIKFNSEGQFISPNTNSFSVNSDTLFVCGDWVKPGQRVKFIRSDSSVEVRFANSNISIYQNDVHAITSEAILPEKASWQIFANRNLYVVMANGKVVLSYMASGSVTIASLETRDESADNSSSLLLVVKNYVYQVDYLDYRGNVVQSQRLKNREDGALRLVTNQNFYDAKGNLIIETLRASYPSGNGYLTTADNVMKYRENFATMDWSDPSDPRGDMDGEVVDFYQDGDGTSLVTSTQDFYWPYVFRAYEVEASNRLLAYYCQGDRGNYLKTAKEYRSPEMYDKFIKNYLGADKIDGVATNFVCTEDPEQAANLQGYTLVNPNMQEISKMVLGKENGAEVSVVYDTNNSLVSDMTHETKGIRKNLYGTPNQTTTLLKSLTLHASRRIHINWGINTQARSILYDSYGNSRLAFITGMDKYIYAKYDRQGRTIESGTVEIPAGNDIYTFYDSVNDPAWPSGSNLSFTPLYQYVYDNYDQGDIYTRGKLASVLNIKSGVRNCYSYDYLGRVIKFKEIIQSPAKEIITEYSLDCGGNILSITFPNDVNETAEYTYDDFGRVRKIILKHLDGTDSRTVFSNACYDLYDRLVKYTNASNITVAKEYDYFANLTSMGLNSGKRLNKQYDDPLSPNRVTKISTTTGSVSTLFSYHPFGWITVFTSVNPLSSYSVTYDNRGNLSSFIRNNVIYNCQNQNDQMTEIRLSDGTLSAAFGYSNTGMLSTISHTRNITIAADDFYASKAAGVHLSSVSNIYYLFRYDWKGRKVLQADQIDTAGNIFYGYGYNGQLAYDRVGGNLTPGKLYLYAGDSLVCEYRCSDGVCISLMYDKENTLRYWGYTNGSTYKDSFVNYSTPWGEINENTGGPVPTRFAFLGMEYLSEFNLYSTLDGDIYLPEYGNTAAPQIGLKYSSPYRLFGNASK